MLTTKLSPVKRYLIIGISVYVFELLVIAAVQALNASSVLAIGISFWAGLVVSFILQKFVTFGDKRIKHKIIIAQIGAFSLLVIFNFGFTILLAKILQGTMPAVIIRTIALGITTLWNFYLYKTKIFKGSEELVY